MATQLPSSSLVFAHPEREPLVFYGPPQAIQGTVRLHNTSDKKLRLNNIAFEGAEIRGPGGVPLQQVHVAARIYPHQQIAVPVEFQADPATPPGSYDVSLRVEDGMRKAVVHVVEEVVLNVQPTEVFLFTDGEVTFERLFVAENAGNVPIRLGGRCVVLLEDPVEVPMALREGLAEVCELPWEEGVKNLLCALSRQHVGPLIIDREDLTLKPGEARSGMVKFTLPGDLKPFRRYVANWGGYGASVEINIYVGEPHPPEPGPKRRRKS